MSARSPLAPFHDARAPSGPTALSVAELDATLRDSVRALGPLLVEGEVAGAKVQSSGHVYFTLKDPQAQASIGCVMWRSDALRGNSGQHVVDGARVQVRASAEVYAPRGQLQLQVAKVTPAGLGELLVRREALRRKLTAEGLFDPARKRPLPTSPRVIGVVTSRSGAAFFDVVEVARRRGRVRILLADSPVQGADAPQSLRRALARLAALAEVDVIILGRGGGSPEDLAAFDDEQLARAIAACPKPVVAAVGHEVDTSIACLVADVRAATPSQAAEIVVADDAERARRLADGKRALARAITARLRGEAARVSKLRAQLRSPERRLATHRQHVEELRGRLAASMRVRLRVAADTRTALERRLAERHPRARLAELRGALGPHEARLRAAIRRRLDRARATLSPLPPRADRAVHATLDRARGSIAREVGRLHAISPLAVLARGYAIALVVPDGAPPRALRDAREAAVGDAIEVRLHHGTVDATVTATRMPADREED